MRVSLFPALPGRVFILGAAFPFWNVQTGRCRFRAEGHRRPPPNEVDRKVRVFGRRRQLWSFGVPPHALGIQNTAEPALSDESRRRKARWSDIMRALVLSFILMASLGMAAQTAPCAPAQASTMQSMTAVDLEKAGDLCRLQKDYDPAIRYYTEALRTDKKNAKLYNKRGLAELSNGAYAGAKDDFTKATRYKRNYPEAWNDLGVVAYMEKKYPAAVKYFSKAIALDDIRPNFHVNLGIAYFAQNQMDLAMAQYTRALQLDPDALTHSSNSALSAMLSDRDQQAAQNFMMARIYAKLGQVDRCLVCLEKAKEDGYSELNNVYKEEDFSSVRKDARLATIVPPPVPQK